MRQPPTLIQRSSFHLHPARNLKAGKNPHLVYLVCLAAYSSDLCFLDAFVPLTDDIPFSPVGVRRLATHARVREAMALFIKFDCTMHVMRTYRHPQSSRLLRKERYRLLTMMTTRRRLSGSNTLAPFVSTSSASAAAMEVLA